MSSGCRTSSASSRRRESRRNQENPRVGRSRGHTSPVPRGGFFFLNHRKALTAMPLGNSLVRTVARRQAAEANLARAATRAKDGKPRTQGRVRRSSRSCACCTHDPEERFPAASSGSRSSLSSGRVATTEFPNGIGPNRHVPEVPRRHVEEPAPRTTRSD